MPIWWHITRPSLLNVPNTVWIPPWWQMHANIFLILRKDNKGSLLRLRLDSKAYSIGIVRHTYYTWRTIKTHFWIRHNYIPHTSSAYMNWNYRLTTKIVRKLKHPVISFKMLYQNFQKKYLFEHTFLICLQLYNEWCIFIPTLLFLNFKGNQYQWCFVWICIKHRSFKVQISPYFLNKAK